MNERKYKKEKQLAGVLVICGYVHLMVPGTTMEERYRLYMNPTLTKIYKTNICFGAAGGKPNKSGIT